MKVYEKKIIVTITQIVIIMIILIIITIIVKVWKHIWSRKEHYYAICWDLNVNVDDVGCGSI